MLESVTQEVLALFFGPGKPLLRAAHHAFDFPDLQDHQSEFRGIGGQNVIRSGQRLIERNVFFDNFRSVCDCRNRSEDANCVI